MIVVAAAAAKSVAPLAVAAKSVAPLAVAVLMMTVIQSVLAEILAIWNIDCQASCWKRERRT